MTGALISLGIGIVGLVSAWFTNWGWAVFLAAPGFILAGIAQAGFAYAFANKLAARFMAASALLSLAAGLLGGTRAHGG